MDLTEVHTPLRGLNTVLPGHLAPPGSLLEAQNVTSEPGVLKQRAGLPIEDLPKTSLGRIEYPLEENTAGLIVASDGTFWDGYSAQTGEVLTHGGADLVWAVYGGVVARRSLYLLTGDMLRSVASPGALVAHRAGAPVGYVSNQPPSGAPTSTTSAADDAYADGDFRAHRVVTLRTVAHDVRSAPSNRLVVQKTAGGGNFRVYVYLHRAEDWIAGDVIELYSTELSATYPNDEYYLNQTHTLTAADITAGYITFLDDHQDLELGRDLYTNAAREGQEAANIRPPLAKAAAVFNGSLWLGDLTYPAGMQVSFRNQPNAMTGDPGVGLRLTSGDLTAFSAVVTNVADTTNLKVGMLVARQSPDEHAGTGRLRITAVTVDSFTLSETWTGANTPGADFSVQDSIRIGAEYYRALYLSEDIRGDMLTGQYAGSTLYTGDRVETFTNIAASGLGMEYVYYTLNLGTILPSTTPPGVWATNGALYQPALPEPTEATGYAMPQDVLPDHVAWSKTEEPDHFPLENLEAVGVRGSKVYTMTPCGGVLAIATDRGLWRAYGYADSAVSFAELDRSVHATSRHCMTTLGRTAYIAAQDGVYAVSEDGVSNLTDDRLHVLPAALGAGVLAGRTNNVRVAALENTGQVFVSCPSESALGDCYVYHTNTDIWTYWLLPDPSVDLTVKAPSQTLHMCLVGAPAERYTVQNSPSDEVESVTISAVSVDDGVTLTVADTSGMSVGDAIVKSSVKYVVVDIPDSTHVTVHETGLTPGSATWFAGFPVRITTIVNTLKTPHIRKVWCSGAFSWFRRSRLYRYGLEFRSAIAGPSADTQNRILSPTNPIDTDRRSAPASTRFLVPRGACRGTHLTVTLAITEALADWAIDSISVKARPTSDNGPTRLK